MSASPFFRNKPNRRIDSAPDAFVIDNADGTKDLLYEPQDKQRLYHAATTPNLIMEGPRGTGKSLCIRWDFHVRALAYPGYTYLILRRTMPELRKSHLLHIGREMDSFTPIYKESTYLKGIFQANYGNGSVGLFGHCETEQDIEKYLSAQFCAIAFDEITTFDWSMITRISSSCRVEADTGLIAIVRGGTNPLGISAEEVYRYFIAKDITPEEDPEYNANDWDHIHIARADNKYLDNEQYDKRFAGLPEAYRKAWMLGEWGVEGAYFSLRSEHLVAEAPAIIVKASDTLDSSRNKRFEMMECMDWLDTYRILDWGWHAADPTVCLWVAVLPNGREVPFMENLWVMTPAQKVAEDIKRMSDGMKVVTTFADPTMWDGEKEMGHCLADEFEQRGIAMTKAVNDRTAAGYAIQEHLNQVLDDKLPKLQILESGKVGCPTLVRALRSMRIDKKRPGRIADHKQDHLPICLGYFCMAGVGPSRMPSSSSIPFWMRPKPRLKHAR